jgi:hypothetical protein
MSLEVSLPQSEDIKSCEKFSSQNNTAYAKPCENFTSQNKTASANDSTKPTDIPEGLSPNQTTVIQSNSPSSSSCMNQSVGRMHRRRSVLRRNSVSKPSLVNYVTFYLGNCLCHSHSPSIG